MGLDSVVTLQEAFVFSCVSSFYFLLFEKKKKGKGKFEGKSAGMHFRRTCVCRTYDKNWEIKKEDTRVTYVSAIFKS